MNDSTHADMIEDPVLFAEHTTSNGKCIGVATLNAPKTLNGLSLDMARLLDERLQAWAANDAIAMVVLQGAGEKAFCAGGDLHGLHASMQAWRASGSADITDNLYAGKFFAVEYRLDYRIHSYPKPILCWGHGIVMGGGIGLMSGASHRVVTERSKLAFPEISIGLYPDVGGSWLLQQVPANGGVFLALTGAPLNAGDALYAGMADWQLPQASRAAVDQALLVTAWCNEASTNAELLDQVLQEHAVTPEPGPLQRHQEIIEASCAHADLATVVAAIETLHGEDAWLTTARQTLRAGSPGSARLSFELQRRAADLSLAEVFQLEYVVSLHCAAHGDFAEGIRALLIDKDRHPHWQPATLAEASAAWAAPFFRAPWPAQQHPLVDLDNDNDTRTTA